MLFKKGSIFRRFVAYFPLQIDLASDGRDCQWQKDFGAAFKKGGELNGRIKNKKQQQLLNSWYFMHVCINGERRKIKSTFYTE